MTAHDAGALLARKGRAAPAGMQRPRAGAPEPVEAEAPEASQAAPAQLPLIAAGEPQEPAPTASLLPFNLRRPSPICFDALGLVDHGDEPQSAAQARAESMPDDAEALSPAPKRRVEIGAATEQEPRGPWLWPVAALFAAAAVVGIAWLSFQAQAPTPQPNSAELAESGIERDALRDAVEPPREAAPDEAAPPSIARTASEAPPTEESAAPAPSRPAEPSATADRPEPAEQPEPPAAAVAEGDSVEPSVDVVRLDPDGTAVLAGRAAPGSELIVLDNGTPLGTTTADAFGEWVFVPSATLPPGDHEFGLVVKAVHGTVTLPASDPSATEPDPAGGGTTDAIDSPAAAPDDAAPIPARKPEAAPVQPAASGDRSSSSAGPTDFVVQLASVKTRAGARQEWNKLRRRFPGILAGMKLHLYETKLADRGEVVRVRTGDFAERREALDFCAQLRAARQECLVVRVTASR